MPLDLPAGVTESRRDQALAAAWLGVVHQVAREEGARVGRLVPPGPGHNFSSVSWLGRDGVAVRLLLNDVVRLVACAEATEVVNERPAFRHVPRSGVFEAAGFRCGEPEQLEADLTPEMVAALSPAEQQHIDYHGVTRVGDVVFNLFD